MKHIITFIMCLSLLICLVGCIEDGNGTETTTASVIEPAPDTPLDTTAAQATVGTTTEATDGSTSDPETEATTTATTTQKATDGGDIELPKVEF